MRRRAEIEEQELQVPIRCLALHEVFGICGQCRTFHPIEVYMESMKLTPGLDSHKKLEYFHSLHHINLCTYA